MEKYFIYLQTKKDVQKKEIAATSRKFRTVYTEIKANTPFTQHKAIVELQKTHGVQLGQYYGTYFGATQIASLISSQMHQRLLDYIEKENRPISLIVDTSDYYNKYHCLSISLQTLENNRPTVYFYKLIQLTSDESAAGLFKALYDSLVEDELVELGPYLVRGIQR